MTGVSAQVGKTLLRVRTPVVLVWLVLIILGTHTYVARFSIDNSVGIWFLETDPDLAKHKKFTEAFGDSEWIIAVLRTASTRDPSFLIELSEAAQRIEALPEISRAISISSQSTVSEVVKNLLVEKGDSLHTAILIETSDQSAASSVAWQKPVQETQEILNQTNGIERYWLAGVPVINAELNRAAQRDMVVFSLVIACLLILFGWFFLGNWRDTAVLVAVVVSSVLPPLTWVSASGLAFNMITLMLPTILVAMSSSLAVHAINEFHLSTKNNTPEHAVGATIGALASPAFWTSATTIVGFLALTQSQVAPIRQVGFLASLGIVAGYVSAVLIAPIILDAFWRSRRSFDTGNQGVLASAWITKLLGVPTKPQTTTAIAVVVFFACILGLSGLRADTDYVKFFKDGRQLNEDYKYVAATGFPQDIVPLDMQFPQTVDTETIRGIVSKINDLPSVDTILPIAPSLHYAAGNEAGATNRFPIMLFTEHLSSNALKALEAQISGTISDEMPNGAIGNLVGTNVLWSNMDKNVLGTQVRSVVTVFCVLLVLLPCLAGSLRIGIFGLLVSVLPVISVLGLMGWAGVPVNVATCLIGGVGLGVAIDDTIFFISRVNRERRAGANIQSAISISLKTVGKAMITTSSIMAVCFLSMGLSDFVPTAQFGVFFSFVLLAAILADLLLLPSLLLVFCRNRPPSKV